MGTSASSLVSSLVAASVIWAAPASGSEGKMEVRVESRITWTFGLEHRGDRSILWCKERIAASPTRHESPAKYFDNCVHNFRNKGVHHWSPPRIQRFRYPHIDAVVAESERRIAADFARLVCTQILQMFAITGDRTECTTGEVSLGPELFLEVFNEPDSMSKLVTMKIFGKSVYLAARLADYWELHRISFQFLDSGPRDLALVISIFDSRLEKNRDGAKNISFSKQMEASHAASVKELLNRISGAFSD